MNAPNFSTNLSKLSRPAPLSGQQFNFLTVLLVFHVVIGSLRHLLPGPEGVKFGALMVAALVLVLIAHFVVEDESRPATWALLSLGLAAAFARNATTFPNCPNHGLLYLVVAILLICAAVHRSSVPMLSMIRPAAGIILLSLWIFSGLHKLLNGYWLNGDFPGFFMLERGFRPVQLYMPEHPLFFVTRLGGPWLGGVMRWVGTLLPTAQIVIPLALLSSRTRNLAIGLFLAMEGGIAIVSFEYEFFLLNLALFAVAFAPSFFTLRNTKIFILVNFLEVIISEYFQSPI